MKINCRSLKIMQDLKIYNCGNLAFIALIVYASCSESFRSGALEKSFSKRKWKLIFCLSTNCDKGNDRLVDNGLASSGGQLCITSKAKTPNIFVIIYI
jgi:hypothetical protein